MGGADAVVELEIFCFGEECGFHVVDSLGEAVEEKRRVGADVVADLHDESGVFGVGHALEQSYAGVGCVGVLRRQKLSWIGCDGGSGYFDARGLEFFDEDRASVVGGLGDADGSDERPLAGHRRRVVDGEIDADG